MTKGQLEDGGSTKQYYVPRVNQLDAEHLNRDITRLIRENFLNNIQALAPKLYFKIQPELDLLVQTAIWFGNFGRKSTTFGQQLLALSYDAKQFTPFKKLLHYILTVLVRYVRNFSESRLGQRCSQLMQTMEIIENIVLMLSILNFFRFLKTGRRPTIIDYIIGLDYISVLQHQSRDIGYKHLTRELLWTGFMETLGILLPIVNFRKLQRWTKNAIKLTKASFGFDREIPSSQIQHYKPEVLATTVCVYCGERPTLPYYMGCQHIYCYYCLAANLCTDSKFSCVQCNRTINSQGLQPL